VDEACDQLDPVTPFSAPVVSLPIFIPVLLLLRRRRQLSQSDAIRSDTGTTLNSVRSFFCYFFYLSTVRASAFVLLSFAVSSNIQYFQISPSYVRFMSFTRV
jgi:hypothetical protein